MEMLAPLALQPGVRLARYELVRFLGEGGFAEVWLARRVDDDAAPRVAVKVVRRHRLSDARARAMFLDEANLAQHIRHPNVAAVYEAGEHEGVPYLVMEYVSGGSLETILRGARAMREPLPIAIGVQLIADVCAGLHAAHELAIEGRRQDLIHRDVSPQNILLTEDGVPKLIDFGIAKARERIAKRTSTGIAKGKIGYMSPEQARGEPLDRRADLWALGAVLYELLEAKPLVAGANDLVRLQALVSRPVRPTFARVPDRIAEVIRRALSFRPRERQETAEELRVELSRALLLEGLAATTAEMAAWCTRARHAAEMTPPSGVVAAASRGPGFAELLGEEATATATVSAVAEAAPSRAKRGWVWVVAGGFLVGAIGAFAIVRLGLAASVESPPHAVAASVAPAGSSAPPAVASAETSPPSAMQSATTTSPPAPPPVTAAPPARTIATVASPVKRSFPEPKPAPPPRAAPKPNDDDQIE